MLEFLSNTVKGLQAIRIAILLKRNLQTGVLEPAVHKIDVLDVLQYFTKFTGKYRSY